MAKPQVRDPQRMERPTTVQVEHALNLVRLSFRSFLRACEVAAPAEVPAFHVYKPSKYTTDLQGETNICILLQLLTFSELRAEGVSMRLVSNA